MKNLAILFILFITSFSASAQAFEANSFNIDVGYALGSHRNAFYSPGVLVNLEFGVHKWIGVGGYFGYQLNVGKPVFRKSNDFDNAHSIPFGVNGVFHFYQMIGDLTGENIFQDKLDIALKPSFGLRFDFNDRVLPSFDWGASFMLRYFISDKVGIYTEFGYPAMGNALIGASFKF